MSGNLIKFLGNAAKTIGTDVYTNGMNAFGSYFGGLVNEHFADRAREKNFQTNEKAAENADKRLRAQYRDLYSPQALMNQYQAAGLSPSMMMSGGAPVVGQSSAQGHQSAGGSGGYPPSGIGSALEYAQIANINADTEGKKIDNSIKDLESKLRESSYLLEKTELQLLSTYLLNPETQQTESLMNAANRFNKYEDFINYVKNDVNFDSNQTLKTYIMSQAGQKTLQDIYKSAHNIDKEVTQIEGDKEYANIMLEIYTKLSEGDFAKLSADERLSELHRIVETNNLEADKKETINNLFNGIENENLRAFLMILYMLGDRYLGSINANYSATRELNKNTSNNTNYNYNR